MAEALGWQDQAQGSTGASVEKSVVMAMRGSMRKRAEFRGQQAGVNPLAVANHATLASLGFLICQMGG